MTREPDRQARERRERVTREIYARVRSARPDLYGRIAAFAGTFGVQLRKQAEIELFCMSLAAELLDGGGDDVPLQEHERRGGGA